MYYIYVITNLVNNKVYIGKTGKSVQSRYKEHISNAHRESRKDKFPLYRAMNKYGINNFKVECLEEIDTNKEASVREQYYIKKFNSCILFENCNGYNMTLGGDGGRCADYEQIVKVYIENNKNEVKTSKILGCTRKTVRMACKELGVHIKPNNKIVRMYDLQGKEILLEFPCIREAIKYFKDHNLRGYDYLYRRDTVVTQNNVFKVIRE